MLYLRPRGPRRRRAVSAGFAVALAASLSAAEASTRRRTPVVEAVEATLPAVVNIGTEQLVQVIPADPLQRFRGEVFDRLFGDMFRQPSAPGYQVRHSLGSGVIVDSNGFILTNFHVVERATVVRVTLVDGRTFPARLIAGDELTDLALIKIDPPEPLAEVRFARDGDLLLGEPVIALGNPFGLSHTVTVGVLSAKNREARYGEQVIFRDILQTDAAVNPGSSGGPLINADGHLIGINVAIQQDAQNIGFAVPVHRVRLLLTHWLSPRAMKHLSTGLELSETEQGLIVAAIDPNGPAARSGLALGDRVIAVNGRAISNLLEYHRLLLRARAGQPMSITAERDGRAMVGEIRPVPFSPPDGALLALTRLGMALAPPAESETVRGGLVITGIREGSPAARAGLREGLRLTRLAGRAVESLEDVGGVLEQVCRGETVAVSVAALQRGDGFVVAHTQTVALTAD